MGAFINEIEKIRDRARQHMEEGAVTSSYGADRQAVLKLLNEALATELVCYLRYTSHAEAARGIHSEAVAAEFLEHAKEEQEHADWLAKRIGQLNGTPNYNPKGMTERSHTKFVESENLMEMIKENLVAERIAIESYMEIIRFLGENDSTSRRLMERILEKEEEHADDLAKLLSHIGATKSA